jgi:predicted hydrolase (HD superfamily)
MEPQIPQQEPFDRKTAYEILLKYMHNPNLLKHSLAAEAAMKGIYQHLYFGKPEYSEADVEKWGITGLLHDADYEMSKGKPEEHGLLLFDYEKNIPPDIKHAIQAHNPATSIKPATLMDWGIRCADQLTGLIVAAALIHPDKALAPLTPEFIQKRMNEKSFAKGADREPILMCEEKLGIPLPEFITIVLKSMQGIHEELGL